MINEKLNICSRFTLAKYSIISFIIIMIILSTIYILGKYLNFNINNTQEFIIFLVLFLLFGIYDGVFIILVTLFIKSTFDKKRIYIINKTVLIPIINIIYIFQIEKHSTKITTTILWLTMAPFFLPYMIYFYFRNRNECKNFNLKN